MIVVIGGITYDVNPLPAMRSWTLQPRLWPAVAEVIAALGPLAAAKAGGGTPALVSAAAAGMSPASGSSSAPKPTDLGDVDLMELLPLVGRFFGRLPPAELELVTRELLYATARGGIMLFAPNSDTFDLVMQGRTMDIWQLVWFAVKVNYPDFFALLGAKGGAAKPGSPSPG